MAQARLNLKNIVAAVVDRDSFARGLVSRMLRGFGVTNIQVAENGAGAKELLSTTCPDVIFAEGALADMPASELINWIRRNDNKALRFQPIIILSGYTQLKMISDARDAGAHLVVRKPLSPQALFDRLIWVAKFDRPFIETPTYVGPDRRFHDIVPPDGELKRATDIEESAAASAAAPASLAKA
jgi:CheY-like chemotaxis protein